MLRDGAGKTGSGTGPVMSPQLMGIPVGMGELDFAWTLSAAFSSSIGWSFTEKSRQILQIQQHRIYLYNVHADKNLHLFYIFVTGYYLSDLPSEEICNVDSVTLPYPLITLHCTG